MGRVVWGWGSDTLTGTADVSVWRSGTEASDATSCRPGPAERHHWFLIDIWMDDGHTAEHLPSFPGLWDMGFPICVPPTAGWSVSRASSSRALPSLFPSGADDGTGASTSFHPFHWRSASMTVLHGGSTWGSSDGGRGRSIVSVSLCSVVALSLWLGGASTSTSSTRIVSWPDITMTCRAHVGRRWDDSNAKDLFSGNTVDRPSLCCLGLYYLQ